MRSGRRGRGSLLAALLVVLLTFVCAAAAAQASLVFVRPAGLGEDSPRLRVFAADDDGSNARLLAAGHSPLVSPDGRRIVFFRNIGERTDLWVMGMDGGNKRRLVRGAFEQGGSYVYGPVEWSADGRSILVTAGLRVTLVSVATGRQRLVRQPVRRVLAGCDASGGDVQRRAAGQR